MKRQRSVKRIFSFSSGTLNRLGIWGAVTGSALDRAAGLLDLRPGGGRRGDALHDELPGHVAHAEQLDGMVRPAHQTGAEQRFGSHLDPVGELREVSHVDHLCGLPERVREAALRDAPDERHLAALESGACLAAGPRGLPLASSAGRLADPRARIAPRLALAVLPRRGLPSHARPPGAACTRWCRAPPPAPSPRAAAW